MIDCYKVKNVNFSVEEEHMGDKVEVYKKQRIERGFDDTEVWNLCDNILSFTLPRLKVLRTIINAHPYDLTYEQWLETLDKMIKGIEDALGEDNITDNEGIKLFFKYFFYLWD